MKPNSHFDKEKMATQNECRIERERDCVCVWVCVCVCVCEREREREMGEYFGSPLSRILLLLL